MTKIFGNLWEAGENSQSPFTSVLLCQRVKASYFASEHNFEGVGRVEVFGEGGGARLKRGDGEHAVLELVNRIRRLADILGAWRIR